MHIYFNPYCDYGRGQKKWQKIEPELRRHFGKFEMDEIHSPQCFSGQIEKAREAGENLFIAAGGDGTVNLLVNALLKSPLPREGIVFGALGLGSSNDFHKPLRYSSFIKDIPTRMDPFETVSHDVIHVRYKNHHNGFLTRYCIVNASIGITAEANAFYNSRHPFVEFVQRFSIETAIVVSALKSIFTYRNLPCTVNFLNSRPRNFQVTNLGVLKNPHFAGSLCYDTLIEADDGRFRVNMCFGMTRLEAVKILMRLYRHQFHGLPKTYSRNTTRILVESQKRFALEMDGEVVHTSFAEFNIVPKALRCCR